MCVSRGGASGRRIEKRPQALESAKERGRERVWLKRRADGELDDERLVDGVAGDRLVFKRRGRPARDDAAPETATAPRRKRRIIFLMDVSGSMYRFHPLDGRLGRMLEATMLVTLHRASHAHAETPNDDDDDDERKRRRQKKCGEVSAPFVRGDATQVMEALEGLDERYEYAVRGHSGDSGLVEFVNFGNPPPNRGERLKVLQRMVAHSQYCDSGDNTIEASLPRSPSLSLSLSLVCVSFQAERCPPLPSPCSPKSATSYDRTPLSPKTRARTQATRRAVSDLRQRSGDAGNHDDDDEAAVDAATSVVVALSDANFHRYGLDPRWWAEALSASEDVQGYAVMVGSIGTEAADAPNRRKRSEFSSSSLLKRGRKRERSLTASASNNN